ncbi:hypothetical protein PBI_GRAYSON_275 [Rhodococcus phage Grayson]|nr:hypothetical protein PBI_GRAYSON_275 [Rhodococcus phage Grayson]
MQFQCNARIHREVNGWRSNIVVTPTFWVEAISHKEAFKKVEQMFRPLLICDDFFRVDTMCPDATVVTDGYIKA